MKIATIETLGKYYLWQANMRKGALLSMLFMIGLSGIYPLFGCSVIYYVDKTTGNIFVANNEDYWYDTKAHLQIEPHSKDKLARLWYGWDNFAQGGVNESGLFFDGAITPEQESIDGYHNPKGNLGDDILSYCSSVEQALEFLESKKIALNNAHMMFGDKQGNAVVVEWNSGERKIIHDENGKLVMTNFLLNDPSAGNYPCPRYATIEIGLADLRNDKDSLTLMKFGNVLARAVQVPRADENDRIGGTLYSSFIDITNMEFVMVYKLDNSKITKLNLHDAFRNNKKRKIMLE